MLDLPKNNFHGNIPLTFEEGSLLTSFKLNDNKFEGPLPPSLVNCKKLEVLDVRNNMITDTFPHMLTTLPELQVPILRSNRFHGPIGDPQTRYPFPKLRIVDISHNEFTGLLPTMLFDNLKAMINVQRYTGQLSYMTHNTGYHDAYQESMILTMKGVDIQMERILTIFMTIDLSSNQFEGTIPDVVRNLRSLKLLNFSHNNLAGPIPLSLRNLKALESLDLSSNNLMGVIPTVLRSLTGLEWLNVSYNKLSRIPLGLQFNTFDDSSFIGNSGLCGPPLSEVCGSNETSEVVPSTSNEEEDDDTWKWFWKIVMMAYVCGLVIGVSTVYMVFSTGRPFWIMKMYERLKPRRNLRRRRERRRGG